MYTLDLIKALQHKSPEVTGEERGSEKWGNLPQIIEIVNEGQRGDGEQICSRFQLNSQCSEAQQLPGQDLLKQKVSEIPMDRECCLKECGLFKSDRWIFKKKLKIWIFLFA